MVKTGKVLQKAHVNIQPFPSVCFFCARVGVDMLLGWVLFVHNRSLAADTMHLFVAFVPLSSKGDVSHPRQSLTPPCRQIHTEDCALVAIKQAK